MSQRFTLDAQIDCVGRTRQLVNRNLSKHRESAVEYEVSILNSVSDTLAWLRDNEVEIRAFIHARRGARS